MILLNKFIFVDLHKINKLNADGGIGYKNNKLWLGEIGFWKTYANRSILLVCEIYNLNTDTSGVCQIDFDTVVYPQVISIVQKYYVDVVDAHYPKIAITSYNIILDRFIKV